MLNAHYNLIVLIPCFQEEKNLDLLIAPLLNLNINLAIVFVVTLPAGVKNETDDFTVKKIVSQNKNNIYYVTNRKRGLGRAYVQGIKYVLENFSFDYLVTLDADNSHNPAIIPSLLESVNKSDIAIASRCVAGGSVDRKDFHYYLSLVINASVRWLLPFNIFDATSGFKIYSKRALKEINLDQIKSGGYFIQLELLFKSLKKEFGIVEIPYNFFVRKQGRSKRRIVDNLEYLYLGVLYFLRLLLNKIINYLKIFFWFIKLFFRWLYVGLCYFSEEVKPFRAMIKITNNCNYQCNICGLWNSGEKKYLSVASQRDAFKRYGRDLFFLTITGGEPFLDKEYLINLIALAKRECPNFYIISINTNGYFTANILSAVNHLLQKYSFLKIYIGLSYIPSADWGFQRTGNQIAFAQSKETYQGLVELKGLYQGRLQFYQMFTVNNNKEVDIAVSRDEEIWINFAEVNDFYNNSNYQEIGKLTVAEKSKLVDYYLQNKKLSILNFVYLLFLRDVLAKGKRQLSCLAGRNRIYLDNDGKEYVCSRNVGGKADKEECAMCWTPCEAVFDIIQHPLHFIILYYRWKIA